MDFCVLFSDPVYKKLGHTNLEIVKNSNFKTKAFLFGPYDTSVT